MDTMFPRLCDLFRQLGLPDDVESVERFIASHRPLPPSVSICEAPFWTTSQSQFLREQWQADAEWSEVVDALASRLVA